MAELSPPLPPAMAPAPRSQRGALRLAMPWHLRLRELVSSFLPIGVMLLLALASWWLVKNSPRPVETPADQALRTAPDYTMSRFALERFAADGRLKLRIEGAQMRHLPATDRIEIDGVKIRALAPDGRVTLAEAKSALAAGDGSEAQLLGGAEVTSVDAAGTPLEMRGEFLHALFVTEQVRSHLPVVVRHGGAEIRAAGLLYDHPAQRLDLSGPTRAVLPARARRP
jgi:lipopolysaccharide export system protein LptC